MFKITNISKQYENKFVAIHDLSLVLPRTGMIAFIGESGAGKTTLLNILSMNDNFSGGSIEYNGVQYCSENRTKIVPKFAFVHQDFKLIENMTVADNLQLAAELSATATATADEITNALTEVGMQDFAGEKVLSLSAGQKQRVAIARSIIQKPEVLFADEPTGNLDSKNSDKVLELLQNLSKSMLVLIVTHDTERIQRYADRIVKLKDGEIVSDTAPLSITPNDNAQNAHVPPCKKTNLSFASTLKLSKSLNGSKKTRQIVFSVIVMLLICFIVPLSSWSFITYEKSLAGTFHKLSNTNGMMLEVKARQSLEYENGGVEYTSKADLSPVQEFIESRDGKCAKVIDISNAKRIFDGTQFQRRIDKNGNPISMAQYLGFYDTSYVILTDNPAEIGIKIIKGTAPKNAFEYMISKGMYEYVNAVGCVKNPDTNSPVQYIDMTGDELIGKEIYGVKIVGVFDDNYTADKKYREHSAMPEAFGDLKSFGDEWANESQKLSIDVARNILCKSVIAATQAEQYYADTYYMNYHSSGKYIEAELVTKSDTELTKFAPASSNTAIFSHNATVNTGEILLPKHIAEKLLLSAGDYVNLKINVYVDVDREQNIAVGELSNRAYKVLVADDIYCAFLHPSDYALATGNFRPDNSLIYFYKKNITAGTLSAINNFLTKTYHLQDYEVPNKVRYIFDYGSDANYGYDTANTLIIIAHIALALVAVIYLALSFNIVSINISDKAGDLLVLKSLGASRMQFAKVYSISMLAKLVCEFAVGCTLGWAVLQGLNALLAKVEEITAVIIPFDAISILTIFGLAIAVNAICLALCLIKINGKNLRKSFQKVKE